MSGDNTRSLEFFEIKKFLREAIEAAFPEVDSLCVRQVGGLSTEAAADVVERKLPSRIQDADHWITFFEDETQGSESEYLKAS